MTVSLVTPTIFSPWLMRVKRWGTAKLRAQELSQGSYYGGRSAADGAIDWRLGVRAVHNLVRAVAPPYPGAFALAGGMPLRVLRTATGAGSGSAQPGLCWRGGEVQAFCADGVLRLLEFELDGQVRDAAAFHARFGDKILPLTSGLK